MQAKKAAEDPWVAKSIVIADADADAGVVLVLVLVGHHRPNSQTTHKLVAPVKYLNNVPEGS